MAKTLNYNELINVLNNWDAQPQNETNVSIFIHDINNPILPENVHVFKYIHLIEFKNCTNFVFPTQLLHPLLEINILRINNCKLTEIPETISNIGYLNVLDVGFNELRDFPSTISTTNGLYSIEFNDNLITNIPDSFWTMKDLLKINASNNQIETISEMACIKSKLVLNLDNNPLKSGPPCAALFLFKHFFPELIITKDSATFSNEFILIGNQESCNSKCTCFVITITEESPKNLSFDDAGESALTLSIESIKYPNELNCTLSGNEILARLLYVFYNNITFNGTKSIELSDTSQLYLPNCPRCNSIPLKLYNILLTGESWYNSWGFQSKEYDTEILHNYAVINKLIPDIMQSETESVVLKKALTDAYNFLHNPPTDSFYKNSQGSFLSSPTPTSAIYKMTLQQLFKELDIQFKKSLNMLNENDILLSIINGIILHANLKYNNKLTLVNLEKAKKRMETILSKKRKFGVGGMKKSIKHRKNARKRRTRVKRRQTLKS